MDKLSEYQIVKKELVKGKSKNVLSPFEINVPFRNFGGLGQIVPFRTMKAQSNRSKLLFHKYSKGKPQTGI